MPEDMTTLSRVLSENGWTHSQENGQRFLHINGEKVRYYDYPEERFNLTVRKMILRNTMAELEMALPAELNPGTALSQDELHNNLRALDASLKRLQPDSTEALLVMQAVAVTEFKLGGMMLYDALDKLSKGTPYAEVKSQYHQGLGYVASAHTHGEFNDLEIMGKAPGNSANAQRKLAINIRQIVDFEEPIEPLITEWYHKIAVVKKSIKERAADLSAPRSGQHAAAMASFCTACTNLLEARRNEPEYAMAQVAAAAEFSRLQTLAVGNASVIEAAQDMYWMARIREPLSSTIAKPPSSMSRYA